MAAGVDQLGELRLADRQAWGDAAHAPELASSKSQMNSRPVPSRVKLLAVLGEHGDARTEQGAAHRQDQRSRGASDRGTSGGSVSPGPGSPPRSIG